MLKATIDISLLNSPNKGENDTYKITPELSLLLTGLHWEGKDNTSIPVDWLKVFENDKQIEDIQKVLYPWRWANPDSLLIFWIDEDKNILTNSDGTQNKTSIEWVNPTGSKYSSDSEILSKNYYEDILNKSMGLELKKKLISNQILWNSTTQNDLEVNDDFEDQKNNDFQNIKDNTGFLKISIGQFAQKLSPLNQLLKLVFFSTGNNEIVVPKKAKYFVAFPIGGEWWKINNSIECVQDGNFCNLQYLPTGLANLDRHKTFLVSSTITEVNVNYNDNETEIKLRDDKGSFKGTVNIKAFDIDDWTDTLLDDLAVHFDLPELMLKFVKENKIKDEVTLKNINDFIWATIRDSIGYGYRVASDGTSVADSVVKLFCEETICKLNEIGQDEINLKKYFDSYDSNASDLVGKLDEITKEPISGFRKADKVKFGTPDLWNKFIEQLNDIPAKYTELDLGLISMITEFKYICDRISLNKYTVEELEFFKDENKYTRDWKRVFEILNNNSVQSLIITLQWQEVDEVKSFVTRWQTELNITDEKIKKYFLFNKIEKIGELKHQQQYSIVSKHKTEITDKDNPIEIDNIQKITDKVIEEIKSYFTYRINPQTQDEKYFPSNLIQPITLNEFDVLLNRKVKPQIESTVTKCIQKPFEIPSSVFLKVDSYEKVQSVGTKPDSDEDLNDEIAGHIVLMQRSAKIGSENFVSNWRYLNKTKVSVTSIDENHNKNVEGEFNNKFIVPAFIPEFEDVKRPYLELRNERLSLIAGHKTFDDSHQENDKPGEKYLVYDFDKKIVDTDTIYPAYAFWYGYNYKFAGFVALNSGVLPKALRYADNIWNIPKDTEIPDSDVFKHATPYYHLRRVPVSKVRVEPLSKVLSPPQGLLPLAFELPEWKDDNVNKENKGKDFEQTHYLLAEGNLSQKEITLELKKPTTSFWNWYAWLGNEANTDEVGKGSLVFQALSKELDARDAEINSIKRKENILCDPAVENILYVKIDKLFPIKEESKFAYPLKLNKVKVDNDSNLNDYLSEYVNLLLIGQLDTEGETQVELDAQNKFIKSIKIKKGDVIRITIHSLISTEHFKYLNQRFHSWMDDVISDKKQEIEIDSKKYLISKPVEIWFEVAKPIATEKTDNNRRSIEYYIEPKELWRSIKVNQVAEKVNCSLIKTSVNNNKLAYASRVEVKHQIWNWNGRLDSSDSLINKTKEGLTKLTEDLDPKPENGLTTTAMKWEAWAFSDRPDYSALVHDENLLASRDFIPESSSQSQVLFTDNRPGEEKALYYRFTAIAHSRYEKLGKPYHIPVEAKLDNIDNIKENENIWKRFLRKSSKTKQLPKPSIRFVIPLTRSIQESNETDIKDDAKISAASLLIVLNDRWFTEAGLAEQLEVGIDVLKNPKGDDQYIQAGNDQILTGNSLSQVEPSLLDPTNNIPDSPIEKNGDHYVAVFKPKGPAGLTFEPKMQTPLVRGSSFILNIPDVTGLLKGPDSDNEVNKMNAWAMIQIAVRRTLRKELCEENISVEALRSGWTAKEWVQFLPAVDSFIPKSWRERVRKEGTLSINLTENNSILFNKEESLLPVFDDIFELRTKRYLVLTETVYDIGGQPCESYVATIKCDYDLDKKIFTYKFNHTSTANLNLKEQLKNKGGYIRIMLVRIDNPDRNEQFNDDAIWTKLFGENATNKLELNNIQNDPTAALPLVSERIPFKI